MFRPLSSQLERLDAAYRDQSDFIRMTARLLAAFTLATLLFVPVNVAKLLLVASPGIPFRIAINACIAAAALFALREVTRGRLGYAGNALVLGTVIPVFAIVFLAPEYTDPLAGSVQLLAFSVVYVLVATIFASRSVAVATLLTVVGGQFAFHHLAHDLPDATAATILRDGLILSAFVFGLGLILMRIIRTTEVHSAEALNESRQTAKNLERLVEDRTRALEIATRAAHQASGAKSDFLANVSHEIRTPLNGIVASADLLLREPNLPPDAATYARLIAESGGLLVSLIGDVLDFSKIEADRLELEIQPFTLARLIDDSNAVAKTQAAGKGVTLRTEVSPDVAGQYLGDRLRLSQVLINLLSNAVKFTDEGGTIDLHVSSIDPKADPASLRFAVRDSGIGMDESTRSRVFERFTQADTSTTRRYGGTGLGLPISARLVAMMGGQLEVDSAVGHGSTFGFTIPLPVCTDAPAALPSPDRPFAALGLRVLVAEDNAINQRILAAQLAKLGCTFTLTADGEEVLNALNQGPLPDVILMDCHMPRLDGWATTARIRSHPADPANTDHGDQLRSLPIIALTAVARPEDRDRCFASGMSGFLSKPIQLTELHHALEPFVTPEN